jgi:hypothetical protein
MKYKPTREGKVYPIESPCKKTMYSSYADARESMDYLMANRNVKELSAYKCTICGFWHLTSK